MDNTKRYLIIWENTAYNEGMEFEKFSEKKEALDRINKLNQENGEYFNLIEFCFVSQFIELEKKEIVTKYVEKI